jgi:propionyl-CoA carboxylase alpha chain
VFNKILIANRGEIALRINRTAQRMGIRTVAVYSDADKYSPHVSACDEAVRIGPPPVKESYLAVEALLAACRQTGADAVHPGYGFLSENAEFASALAAEGIAFIGPQVEAIRLMGDKIAANRQAREAGVPTIPGHWEMIPSADEAVRIGREIGYPVMLKAAAGGGGKGMRIARSDADLKEAFRVASSEARTAFGDDRVFIEKFIENPRHIEIQILADRYGNTLYLGERECSIQRRHQKVIEEAPSPFVTPELRRDMGERSVALAKSVNYQSAGTVEYVTDPSGQFFFLEMNTRLQVEHSVTEFTTGLDLVEWMIRIAAGEPLDIAQGDVVQSGWSIEARIYAEDPNRGFLPSTGRLVRYRAPEDDRGLRVDSGVYEGAEISMFYDPMIAKVTTWERDRPAAIEAMRRALDDVYIKGVRHNVEFLAALMANPRFLAGDFSTRFIEQEYPDGFVPAPIDPRDMNDIIAVAALMHLRYVYRGSRISGQMPSYGKRIPMEWMAVVNGEFYPVTVTPPRQDSSEEGFDLHINDHSIVIRSTWQIGDPVLDCTINAKPRAFTVERNGLGYRLHHLGAEIDVRVYRGDVAELARMMPKRKAPDLSKFLMSPMPGQLRSLAVSEGEKVNAGDELAIVEAMKMENALKAGQAAVIGKVHAKPGDVLSVGQVILEFE